MSSRDLKQNQDVCPRAIGDPPLLSLTLFRLCASRPACVRGVPVAWLLRVCLLWGVGRACVCARALLCAPLRAPVAPPPRARRAPARHTHTHACITRRSGGSAEELLRWKLSFSFNSFYLLLFSRTGRRSGPAVRGPDHQNFQ